MLIGNLSWGSVRIDVVRHSSAAGVIDFLVADEDLVQLFVCFVHSSIFPDISIWSNIE